MNLNFRKMLLSGKTLIGTVVTQPNPAMAEIIADAAKPFLNQGYTLIAVGIDTMIFGQAARDIVAEMKGDYAGQKR